ncbi:Programmed cell death 1 ligand 1 [Channa argus]|uniref:Programmed cell death 1 ligand 1 n=1 Tax=Channa argus TaxID=215402 RepID=A0A6G1Q6U7_CHAAH|nr:Programmed cell death 1 ligand 1 [Channa argus]
MFDSRKILFVCLLPCSVICLTSEEIRAKPGDNVILQCRGPREGVIELLEWSKPDLKSEDYVFYFREQRVYEMYQHPLFRGRVELRDPQMKEGNFAVILKNVTIKDSGTYMCFYGNGGNGLELISNITLTVRDSAKHVPPSSASSSLRPTDFMSSLPTPILDIIKLVIIWFCQAWVFLSE